MIKDERWRLCPLKMDSVADHDTLGCWSIFLGALLNQAMACRKILWTDAMPCSLRPPLNSGGRLRSRLLMIKFAIQHRHIFDFEVHIHTYQIPALLKEHICVSGS